MSTFIDKTDYDAHIRSNRLDQVTEFTDALLGTAENRAIGFVGGYLSGRYDIDAIFAATGDSRNATILGYTIDISLYYLWRLVAPRKVPAYVKEAYDEAKEWLAGVQAGEIVATGLPVTTSETAGATKWGSNPRRTNHV